VGLWLGASDIWRARLHLVFLLILVGGLGTLLWAAWHGGELVYTHAVGVSHERGSTTSESTRSGEEHHHEHVLAGQGITYFLPPMETHVTLAGLAAPVAIATIGLRLRP